MAIKTTQHWHAWCFLSALFLASVSLCAQQANYQKHGDVLLPDDSVTPGAVALTDTNEFCSTKWGVDERAVSAAMKSKVYALYGTAPLPARFSVACEKHDRLWHAVTGRSREKIA